MAATPGKSVRKPPAKANAKAAAKPKAKTKAKAKAPARGAGKAAVGRKTKTAGARRGSAGDRPGRSEGEMLRFVEDLKRQWMSTIDALVDPLMIVDKDYTIRKANLAMARIGGLKVKDIVGRKCHKVFADRQTPCPGCSLTRSAREEASTTFHLDHVRDGRFYEVTSQRLIGSDGDLDGIVQVYRDRTDAKRMQEQLAQQDKLASIGLLAGGVAHEINNPLGGILIFSQMLLRELPKESSHYADVVEIEAATQRCKAIVEGLLDFARQNPVGGVKDRREDLDALEAIRTAMRFGRVSIQRGGMIDMREDFQGDDHRLHADRNRIIQLFLNLIQNGVQAMPDGGTLSLRASVRPDGAGGTVGVYEVEDTGVGIAPEHLKQIFDPFFTTKDPGEGTGLGLALCYGIVQELGGTMGVESTVNVGTRFTIELPLGEGRSAVARPAS